MTAHISCRSLTQIGLQIPRSWTKWRPCKGMAVSQAFIFHLKCYSMLHFAVCQLLGWAFLIQFQAICDAIKMSIVDNPIKIQVDVRRRRRRRHRGRTVTSRAARNRSSKGWSSVGVGCCNRSGSCRMSILSRRRRDCWSTMREKHLRSAISNHSLAKIICVHIGPLQCWQMDTIAY